MERVSDLHKRLWAEQLARDGLTPVEISAPDTGGEVACPACGHVGPLVGNACSDCGLVLG